jgi:alpha 1,2-mannosyltransferase
MQTIREAANETDIRFQDVSSFFSFGSDARIDPRTVPEVLNLAGHKWSVGYRHMSRFFCHGMFQLQFVQELEFYWRLDADSMLLHHVEADPFDTMKKNGRVYGYNVIAFEDVAVAEGLFDAVKHHFVRGSTSSILGNHVNSKEWNKSMFYTNFEISRVDFWRSSDYTRFFRDVDEAGGVYQRRWGDAPIHFLAVAALLKDEQLQEFSMPYWHQYYVHLNNAQR